MRKAITLILIVMLVIGSFTAPAVKTVVNSTSFQQYYENIKTSSMPQLTELLQRVSDFSENVTLIPGLGGFNHDIINGDWGIFNWAKKIVEIIIYPFVWGYNICFTAWMIFDLFI